MSWIQWLFEFPERFFNWVHRIFGTSRKNIEQMTAEINDRAEELKRREARYAGTCAHCGVEVNVG